MTSELAATRLEENHTDSAVFVGGHMATIEQERLGKGAATRERLLEIAEAAIVAKGFSNTSIDEIIAEAGLTKSGFFYHFSDKTELAKALLHRFLRDDAAMMDGLWARGRELSDDPLQALLITLKLFAEQFADLEETHPGCIVAAIAYHDRQFNDEVRGLNAQAVEAWRARLRGSFAEIEKVYRPRIEIDTRHLADMLCTIVDGALIVGRVVDEPRLVHEQVMLYRQLLRGVFAA